MAKKEVLGIRIRPVEDQPVRDNYRQSIHFCTEIARSGEEKFAKGFMFISSPAIQEAIKRNKWEEGEGLGNVLAIISHEERLPTIRKIYPATIHIHPFHPFDGDYENEKGKYVPAKAHPDLIDIGAGTIVEHAIEKFLRKRFPHYQLRTSFLLTPRRYNQLVKRGRKFKSAKFNPPTIPGCEGSWSVDPTPTPIEEAERLSKRQMLKQRQKNRHIRR